MGGRFEFKHKEGIGTCWEESPRLAIDIKVYKRMYSLTLRGLESVPNFLYL